MGVRKRSLWSHTLCDYSFVYLSKTMWACLLEFVYVCADPLQYKTIPIEFFSYTFFMFHCSHNKKNTGWIIVRFAVHLFLRVPPVCACEVHAFIHMLYVWGGINWIQFRMLGTEKNAAKINFNCRIWHQTGFLLDLQSMSFLLLPTSLPLEPCCRCIVQLNGRRLVPPSNTMKICQKQMRRRYCE